MAFFKKPSISKDYFLWFAGDTAFDIGTAIQQTAVPLVAFAVTQSTKVAGLIATMEAIGRLIALIPGGLVADYFDRRRTLMLLGAVDAIVAFFLAALLFTGQANLIWLMILAFLAALIGSIVTTTNNALLKNVVTTEQFPTAMSLNQGRNATITIIGGPIGGALFALATALPAAVYSLSAFIRVVTARLLKSTGGSAKRSRQKPFAAITTGLRLIYKEPILRSLAIIGSLINFAGTAIFLTVILDLQQKHTSPALIGSVFTAVGLSALVGAPLAGLLMKRIPTGKLIMGGFIVEAIALSLLAFSANIWWILGCLFVAILGLPAINGALAGFLMAAVPSDFQGRVGSSINFLVLLTTPLAPLSAGFLLEDWGRTPSILLSSMVFLLTLMLSISSPAIRQLGLPDKWEEQSANIRAHCEALG